jgi:Domain of unknown function (DU1801)
MAAHSSTPIMRPSGASVRSFLASVPDARHRDDARRLCALLQEITDERPAMWAQSIVGFGRYHYRYASGHEGDAPLVSFAPRAQHLVLYLSAGLGDRYPKLLHQLGPHKAGKGCLYLKRLDDADPAILRQLVERSVLVHRSVGRAST